MNFADGQHSPNSTRRIVRGSYPVSMASCFWAVTTYSANMGLMAKKYDCAFVDNEMPYGRVPQGHPVIVDYFYHEEIRGTENTGKRNR